jgi:hypothetical protein
VRITRRGVEVGEHDVVVVLPPRDGRVEDRPLRLDVGAGELDPGRLANGAVQTVASDDPLRDDLAALAVMRERRRHRLLGRHKADQTGRAGDRTALRLEEVGEDRLGDLLGKSDVEPVAAPARPEVELAQDVAVRPKPRRSGPDALGEKPGFEPQRFEDLHRPRVHDRRPVPAPRSVQHIDQPARHVASLQLRREQQPGRAGADHEHLGTRIAHHRHWRGSLRIAGFPSFLGASALGPGYCGVRRSCSWTE